MASFSPFEGSIQLIEKNKKKVIYRYDKKPDQELGIDQTFIHCFDSLELTADEKKHLSVKDRTLIHHYQSFKEKDLRAMAHDLISAIEQECQGCDIEIVAEHLGAFICLAAIFSGQLPLNKHISFRLGNAPFNIFPKRLSKKALPHIGGFSVSFFIDDHCWLGNIESIYQLPEGLEQEQIIEKKSA